MLYRGSSVHCILKFNILPARWDAAVWIFLYSFVHCIEDNAFTYQIDSWFEIVNICKFKSLKFVMWTGVLCREARNPSSPPPPPPPQKKKKKKKRKLCAEFQGGEHMSCSLMFQKKLISDQMIK